MSGIFAEYMIANLLDDMNTKNDPYVKEFKLKIENIIEAQHFDATAIRWLSPLIRKRK